MFREDDEGGRARVTTDKERVAAYCEDVKQRRGYKVRRLGSCENFACR